MADYKGDFTLGDTIRHLWPTNAAVGASANPTDYGTVYVFKDQGQGTYRTDANNEVTFTTGWFSGTIGIGVHSLAIESGGDAFYTAGADYDVVESGVTLDGQTINTPLFSFSIENRCHAGGFTTDEIKQIRSALGIDGTKTAATGGQLQTLDTVADAVKAKTDNLPSDPADQSLIIAATDAIVTEVNANETKIDAVQAKTDNLPASPAAVGSAMTLEADQAVNLTKIDGQATNGNNATLNLKQLNIVNNAGHALIARSTGANGVGVYAQGYGTGEGISAEGGPTGHGLTAYGGSGSGHGIVAQAITDGHGVLLTAAGNNDGLHAEGSGTGKDIKADIDGTIGICTTNSDMRGTDSAALASVCTEARLAELAAANLPADVDAIKAKTDNLPASPAAVGSAMTLADDAITAGKFDESTAFPLKSADSAATQVARTGADGDTLETLSDQIDGVGGGGEADWTSGEKEQIRDALGVDGDKTAATGGQLQTLDGVCDAVKAKTDNLPSDPADQSLIIAATDAIVVEVNANETKIDGIKAKTDNLPSDPADQSLIIAATDAIVTEVNANETKIDAVQAKTDNLPASPAAVGSAMTLADDAITAGKFDETTAYPLKSADSAATQVARTGADGDTLETLSDQIDGLGGGGEADWTSGEKEQIRDALGVDGTKTAATGGQLQTLDGVCDAVKAKTDNLPSDPADQSLIIAATDAIVVEVNANETKIDGIKAKTDNLPSDPADQSLIIAATDAIVTEVNANETKIDGIKAKTDNLPASPAAVGSAMTLADDAITAGKFDETTAYPLKSADSAATQVARTGADGDTLETLSDQIDGVGGGGGGGWDDLLADHDTEDTFGWAVNNLKADAMHKKVANKQSGETTVYDEAGTTPLFARTLTKVSDDEVALVP